MAARLDFGPRSGTVWLPPGDEPGSCPVELLARWQVQTGGDGPVFPSPDDPQKPMTRQGVVQRLDRLVDAHRAASVTRRGELPVLAAETRHAVIAALTKPSDAQVRDLAVIAAMFWFGLRADEAKNLDVGDLELSERGAVATVRVEKNRPYGDGPATPAERQDGFIACPLRSLRQRLDRYERRLGQTLEPTDPLFVGLNRGGQAPRLGYSGINGLVSRWADAAGVRAGRYERVSSHGLRAAHVVALIQAGRSAEEIARAQRRKSTQHLLDYYRPAHVWGASPNAGLVDSLAAAPAEAAAPADEHPPDRKLAADR